MYMNEYAMGGWSFFMLIFWVLVIVAIVWLATSMKRQKSPENEKESEMDILRKRFARGEIDANQYEEMKRLLSDG